MTFNELCCYGTRCIICGEDVVMNHKYDTPKVCDRCKAAVLKVRKEMEKGEVDE